MRVVFDGVVRVPTSPSVSGFTGWAKPNSFRIDFSSPSLVFPRGGGLVLELDGSSTPARLGWPVDTAGDDASGEVTKIGRACGPLASEYPLRLSVHADKLVPGDTTHAVVYGTVGNLATLLMGISMLQHPVDLGAIGSPGCIVYVDPLASVPAYFKSLDLGAWAPGRAHANLRIPNSLRMLGGRLTLQWIELGSNIWVTEAASCTVARVERQLGICMVRGLPGSPTGVVSTGGAPVVRFHVD